MGHPTSLQILLGKPKFTPINTLCSKSPQTLRYKPDGTGRDTYVISGDGGLHNLEYKGPHSFGKNLRYAQIALKSVGSMRE